MNPNAAVHNLTKTEIESLIPHRDPFLWIDEAFEIAPGRLFAKKYIDPQLDVFRGHYPGRPVLPGVLLCEAAMQAGALLIALQAEGALGTGQVPVATRLNNVKFKQMVRPGDTLDIAVDLTERVANAFFLTAAIKVGGKTVATLEFACAAADG